MSVVCALILTMQADTWPLSTSCTQMCVSLFRSHQLSVHSTFVMTSMWAFCNLSDGFRSEPTEKVLIISLNYRLRLSTINWVHWCEYKIWLGWDWILVVFGKHTPYRIGCIKFIQDFSPLFTIQTLIIYKFIYESSFIYLRRYTPYRLHIQ